MVGEVSAVRNRLLITLILGVLLIVLTVVGLRYVIVRPITCTPVCIGENLLGRDLQGLDLAGANFVEANLQGADLRAANLRQVDLSGANLTNANLRNADLSEAQLIGANLTGADLGGTRLSGANLAGAILDRADLTAVDLTEVALQGASFGEAKLTNARLNGANLNGLQLAKANLSGAVLDKAGLSGANLSSADLSGVSLRGVDLTGAWLNITNLTGADLTGADLSGSRLIGARLTSANLADSRLQGAVVIGATLNGANVRGADLRRLRGLAINLTTDDLRLDPVLAELNELKQRELQRDVTLQGLAFDALTQWDPALQPAEALATTPPVSAPAFITDTAAAAADADATTTADGFAASATAQPVKVNFYVNALRNAPGQPGAYEVDFYLDSLWQEADFTPDKLTGATADQFFDPLLEVVNASQVQEVGRRYDRSFEPGTNLRLRQRLSAIFAPPLDLRPFPFDRQVISLQFESAEYDSESLQLDLVGLVEPVAPSEKLYSQSVPRGRYIDSNAIDPEWRIDAIQIGQVVRVLPYDNSTWSQFRVDLVVKRVAAGYLWRIWAVLAGLWLLVGTVLLVDSRALTMRLWLLFLLFWVVVAFQAILTRVLPPIDAFTLFDRYLLICYCAIVLMAILILLIHLCHLWGRERWARWVNRVCVILYPTVFVVVNVWVVVNALG